MAALDVRVSPTDHSDNKFDSRRSQSRVVNVNLCICSLYNVSTHGNLSAGHAAVTNKMSPNSKTFVLSASYQSWLGVIASTIYPGADPGIGGPGGRLSLTV